VAGGKSQVVAVLVLLLVLVVVLAVVTAYLQVAVLLQRRTVQRMLE